MTADRERLAGLSGFRYALRRFLAASEVINHKAGITQPQYQAMLAIAAWENDAMAMKDLADELLLTHHAAVQLVDRLAAAGLAERTPSPDDRRSVRLRLTARGGALLDELAAFHLDEILRQEPLLSRSLKRLRRLAP